VQPQDARKNYIGIVNDTAEEESLAGGAGGGPGGVVAW
jgi:hypothetical protein